MRTLTNPRFKAGDYVTRVGDDRKWYVYEVYVNQDDAWASFYVYRIYTLATRPNSNGDYGTKYSEARGSQLRKAK